MRGRDTARLWGSGSRGRRAHGRVVFLALCGSISGLHSVAFAEEDEEERASLRDEPASPTAEGAQDPDPETPALTSAEEGEVSPALVDLPRCRWSLEVSLSADALVPPGPGSGGFVPFDTVDRSALELSLRAFGSGDGAQARVAGEAAGYDVCRAREGPVALWIPRYRGRGRAAFAWRAEDAAALIVGAPHPHFEWGTRHEAILLFKELPARALVVSGTHRCAATESSPCSGTTRVCSDDLSSFRISDMAHTEESAFQTVHLVLADMFPDDWVVSLHGMHADGISVSDGTTGPLEEGSAAMALLPSLQALLPDQFLTACNAQGLVPVDTRLCGTTNAQGRFLNQTDNACVTAATRASGRFVHLEQSRAVRATPRRIVEAFRAALGVAP